MDADFLALKSENEPLRRRSRRSRLRWSGCWPRTGSCSRPTSSCSRRSSKLAAKASVQIRTLEEESVAGQVLRWAEENPAFAAALRPEVLAECQRLVAFGAGSSHLSAEAWSAYQRGGAEGSEG